MVLQLYITEQDNTKRQRFCIRISPHDDQSGERMLVVLGLTQNYVQKPSAYRRVL